MTRTRARRRVTLPTVEIIDPTDARLAKGDLVPIIDQYGRRPADSMRYRVRTAIEKAYDDERLTWEQLEAARSYYRDAYHVERPSVAMMHWRDLVDGATGESQFDTEFHRARLARVRKRLGPRLTRVMNLAVVHDASFVMIGTEIAGRNNTSQAWAVGFELVVTALDMAKDEYGIGRK